MCLTFAAQKYKEGGLAQLARALAWHARGHRFDSDILHKHFLSTKKAVLISKILSKRLF